MTTIPTLSLWQPWASLWAFGEKKIETRSWRCRMKPPVVLAVHAARKWDAELETLCDADFFSRSLIRCGYREADVDVVNPSAIPRGCVVGLVRVGACEQVTPTSRWEVELSEEEQRFGDYSPGRYGWIADRFHPFAQPYPLRGAQGVFSWNAPDDVLEIAKQMLGS